MFFYICLIILYIPLLLLFPTRVIGKKNIPKKGKFILASNHQTFNDAIIIAYKLTKRRFRFMAKKELFKNKLFGAILKGIGAYPIDNKSVTDLTAIKKTMKYLNEDKAVCIFPEGTRVESDENNQLKHGVAMLALRTSTPVVPMCLVKKTYAFRFNKLVVGEPIYLHEMEQFKNKKVDKDVLEQATTIINHGIYDLKAKYEKKK